MFLFFCQPFFCQPFFSPKDRNPGRLSISSRIITLPWNHPTTRLNHAFCKIDPPKQSQTEVQTSRNFEILKTDEGNAVKILPPAPGAKSCERNDQCPADMPPAGATGFARA